ncbi:MAG TPA: hypothetical protein VMU27_00585 [Candidatus Paceibacterota bacterium]|nr:hypothetical protein [Candidatus Paceibacterota bacterium]
MKKIAVISALLILAPLLTFADTSSYVGTLPGGSISTTPPSAYCLVIAYNPVTGQEEGCSGATGGGGTVPLPPEPCNCPMEATQTNYNSCGCGPSPAPAPYPYAYPMYQYQYENTATYPDNAYTVTSPPSSASSASGGYYPATGFTVPPFSANCLVIAYNPVTGQEEGCSGSTNGIATPPVPCDCPVQTNSANYASCGCPSSGNVGTLPGGSLWPLPPAPRPPYGECNCPNEAAGSYCSCGSPVPMPDTATMNGSVTTNSAPLDSSAGYAGSTNNIQAAVASLQERLQVLLQELAEMQH